MPRTNYVIAESQEKANEAAQARGLDVIVWLPNKKSSADRLRGVSYAWIWVTNVKVNKHLLSQIRLIDRGGILFDWIPV